MKTIILFSIMSLALVGCGRAKLGLNTGKTVTKNVGPQGPAGIDGKDGKDGINGQDGVDGNDGARGSVGAQGPKGDAGERGPKGHTGAKGEKGDVGKQGPRGDVGPMGEKGKDGKDGSDGVVLKIHSLPVRGACVSLGDGIFAENEGDHADVYNNDACAHSGGDRKAFCNDMADREGNSEVCWVGKRQFSINGVFEHIKLYELTFNTGDE